VNATSAPTRRRAAGLMIVAVLFALLALNALKEAFWSDSPPALRALQALVAATAAATAWGAWIGAGWSIALATLYGLIAGGMVVALGPMLDLPTEARGGLWVGGAVVLLFSLACAWYLRRATQLAPVE
jgi:hypothetical protein